MEKIGIFGKKNSLVKYNLSSHKSLWTANLPHGQTPKAIAQYEDFLIVIDQNWAGTKNISCFNEKTGVLPSSIAVPYPEPIISAVSVFISKPGNNSF